MAMGCGERWEPGTVVVPLPDVGGFQQIGRAGARWSLREKMDEFMPGRLRFSGESDGKRLPPDKVRAS
jgi:hypothetical protein